MINRIEEEKNWFKDNLFKFKIEEKLKEVLNYATRHTNKLSIASLKFP